jgi:hypothetical protein
MGQSIDAILFYGLVWDEEAELWENDRHDEWIVALAKRRGITSPWDFYRDSGAEAEHQSLRYEDQKKAYYYWKESVDFESMLKEWDLALKAIRAEHPSITVGSHCSCDYPMPFICVGETYQRAWRGTPVGVNMPQMAQANTIRWNDQLNDFIKALDIDISDAKGPGWFLVSNWC